MQYLISVTGRWYITFTNKTVLTTFVYFTHYSIIIVQARYITIETREVARIWYNGLLFPHNLRSGEGIDAPRPSPEYSSGKRNPLYAIRETSFFSSIVVLYLIQVIVRYLIILDLQNSLFVHRWGDQSGMSLQNHGA